jgi:hypothetical protein
MPTFPSAHLPALPSLQLVLRVLLNVALHLADYFYFGVTVCEETVTC